MGEINWVTPPAPDRREDLWKHLASFAEAHPEIEYIHWNHSSDKGTVTFEYQRAKPE